MKSQSMPEQTRRGALALGVGAALLTIVRPARASLPATMEDAIKAFTGGAVVKTGRIKLDIPPLVENGNSVSMTVRVESPMTPENYVRTIAVFNEKNPQPNVANFHLTPRSGRAEVSTRIRLATTQHITAIAKMSDGSLWSDTIEVIVTIAACTEE